MTLGTYSHHLLSASAISDQVLEAEKKQSQARIQDGYIRRVPLKDWIFFAWNFEFSKSTPFQNCIASLRSALSSIYPPHDSSLPWQCQYSHQVLLEHKLKSLSINDTFIHFLFMWIKDGCFHRFLTLNYLDNNSRLMNLKRKQFSYTYC